MAAKKGKAAISPERLAEIAADAHSGRNWAQETVKGPTGTHGPTCVCGAGERLYEAAMALRGRFGLPTRGCTRHPGGTVARKPEGTKHPGENGN